MIKFEEHEGQLFRMLEEPVPLAPDSKLPCLVRLIQDDSPMGLYNKNHRDTFAGIKLKCFLLPIVATFIDNNNIVNAQSWEYYRYEIIGYPVEEGSHWWALYQMMQGKMVCHETSPRDWYRMYNDHAIQNRTVGYMDRVSAWLESTVQSGWQIYKEPKPLLAEAKVGDLVRLRNGSYSQIVEVEGTSLFKYQNPEVVGDVVALFWCDENGDTTRWGKLKDIDIIHTEPLAPEGSAEWAWQMLNLLRLPVYHPAEGVLRIPIGLGVKEFVRSYAKIGWQIYEPEPKPLLADAQVGDLCKRSNGRYTQFHSKHKLKNGSIVYYFTDASGGTDIDGNHCIHECGNNIISCEPLATEGTVEWAGQMLKLGKMVKHENNIYPHSLDVDGKVYYCHEHRESRGLLQEWIIGRGAKTGWQIYEEPEPEQQNHMPTTEFVDLYDAPDGWICKTRDGGNYPLKYIEASPTRYAYEDKSGLTVYVMANGRYKKNGTDGRDIIACEPEPPREPEYIICKRCGGTGYEIKHEPAKEQFEVGDWVEVNANGVKKQGKIMRFCEADFLQDNTNALVLHDVFDRWYGYHRVADITHKLSPSEVILDFGSGIKGTVRSCEHDGGCVRVISGDRVIAHIMTDVLEQPTRNLVMQLLKAQEEQ